MERIDPVTEQSNKPLTQAEWADVLRYSDVSRAGDLLFVSGQVGLDDNDQPQTDPTAQYRAAFESLRKALATVGARPEDVVDLMSYHTNYPNHVQEFIAAKNEFQGDGRPSWTAVGVANLALPDTLVEIKAVAFLPEPRA